MEGENSEIRSRIKKKPKQEIIDDDELLDSKNDKSKINWTAVFILMLFFVPALITVVMQAMDYLYPQAATARIIRQRLVKCYDAANPKKLSEVDYLLKKYKNKEHILFAQVTI